MGKVIDHLGIADASRVVGISPSLLGYRARAGKVKVVSLRPLRFRLSDLLDYTRTMPPKRDNGAGRKGRCLQTIIEELLTP